MVCRQSNIGFDISDFVCRPRKGGWTCVVHTAQFRSMVWSVVDAGRPRTVGPGVSATYHHVLMHHACLHLIWLLLDGCHTTSESNVSYWVILVPLYAVSLGDDWFRPDGVQSDLTCVEYRCWNTQRHYVATNSSAHFDMYGSCAMVISWHVQYCVGFCLACGCSISIINLI